jgi:hypothetical protein
MKVLVTAHEAGLRWGRHPNYFLKLGRLGILSRRKLKPVQFFLEEVDELMMNSTAEELHNLVAKAESIQHPGTPVGDVHINDFGGRMKN